ncbi:hypothetical protein SAMN05444157_1080 [Frankineae bacterium MT45]|nr:hypothetical protein SAMN05444157_1080 [Frankineae bacterium MT45]
MTLLVAALLAALLSGTAATAAAATTPTPTPGPVKLSPPITGKQLGDTTANAPVAPLPDLHPGLDKPLANFTTKDSCATAAAGYAKCFSKIVTPAQGTATPAIPLGWGPADLASAYRLATANGKGLTVAIVDAYSHPTIAANLNTYRAAYGLPACTVSSGCFKILNQSGATSPLPAANVGWATEIALDVDMVSAVCPLCNIVLVEANSNSTANLAAAANMAAGLPGVVAVSNSYGAAQSSGETAYNSYYTHPGIVTTASTGDHGYGVSYPSAAPSVVAVGGTRLVQDSSTRGWSETAWSGAGSGCSLYEAKPAWQTDSGCSKRTVADVSAVADPATPVAMYSNYGHSGWITSGGTSVSAPIIAAVAAEANADFRTAKGAQGFYRMQNGYGINDVLSGSNGSCGGSYLCTAGYGYDGPTGVGTPYTAPRDSYGYVWADQPSTASYTPSTTYSYNSYGGANSIVRNGVGSYTVTFGRLASGGTVDVTAYSTNARCKVGNWYHSGGNEVVNVYCFSNAGVAVDSYYDVVFANPAGIVGSANLSNNSLGYVWANQPTTTSYTPSTFYQYNNQNLSNTITRNGVGDYTITFTRLSPVVSTNQGTVKVTAYGSSNYSCISGGWYGPASSPYNESVTVRCYTATGAPVDTYFTASYAAHLSLTGKTTAYGYVWGNSPSSASYTPAAAWSYNSTGQTNTITRSSAGNYMVTIPGQLASGGDIQVTSYGADGSSCRSTGWAHGSTATYAYLQCVNSAGVAVDHYFNLQYVH